MANLGMCSRVGFRVMAWTFTRSRPGLILEERRRRSGVREGQTVLDYACGPGCYTIPAARMVGPTGRVYALDIQPAAAAMVRDRARVAGIHNVTTVVSGRDTGLPAGSVDLVLLYDAIAGITDKRRARRTRSRFEAGRGAVGLGRAPRPALTLPLVTENSRFVLRVRMGDILNVTREESRSPAG